MVEKIPESPLDSKEIKPGNLKGDQPWIFPGRTDAEAPVLWPPDVKNWLIGKDSDAGKDRRQEKKGTAEDEMAGWHHWLNGHEFESVMPSSHIIFRCPLLLPLSIFPSIRVFSSESVLHIRWPKYWSFSFSISPSKVYSGLISLRMDWLDLLAIQGTLKSLPQHHSSKASFFGAQLSLWPNYHIHTWLLEQP